MSLKLKGDELKKKYEFAVRRGMDRTLSDCVVTAKPITPFKTGVAKGSIQIVEFAKRIGTGYTGVWGSVGINYFIYLELGTSRMAAFRPLRRAADKHYKQLSSNIKRALKVA